MTAASARFAAGVLAVAAVGGCATMAVELSAVRLLAPWFGTSLAVWTNVIGVILLALSIGYLLGARLSAGRAPLFALGVALLASAAFTAWLPALAAPVCATFMPAGVALHDAAGLLAWGSLAAAALLFLPSAALLGTVGPLAVEALQRASGVAAGTAGGRVLAASTLGSLAGTFATSHLLLPGLGLRRSFLLCALALGAAGALALLVGRARRVGATLALVALLAGLPAGRAQLCPPPPPEGFDLRLTRESAYQWVRVIEERATWLRYLQVNEGLDSFQSVWLPHAGLLGEGYYYDYFTLPPWWSAARGRWRVLVLGLGGGTVARLLEACAPEGVDVDVLGVELDPEVVAAGRRLLGLRADGAGLRVLAGLDARVALSALEESFDQIVVDVYANQFEIPAHLCTLEFFREVAEHLVEGGWLSANVGGFGLDDPVISAVASTAADAFGNEVLLVRVPRSRNAMLFARRGTRPAAPGEPGWAIDGALGESLLPRLELAGAVRRVAPGDGAVLSDDRCPIERLQQRSLMQAAARVRVGRS